MIWSAISSEPWPSPYVNLQGNTIMETYINYLSNWSIIAQIQYIGIYTILIMLTIKTANNKI